MTQKQTKFIDAYMGEAAGNATEAAKLAGYSKKTAYSIGQENLKKPEILQEINKRSESDPLTTSRIERQRWWSSVVRDETAEMKDRLRASELLARSQGDFITKVESESELRVQVVYEDEAL